MEQGAKGCEVMQKQFVFYLQSGKRKTFFV